MTLTTLRLDDGTVLVAGDIDIATAPALEAVLADPTVRAVDLSGVTFIDVVGLRVFFGRDVAVRSLSRPVQRLIEVCNLAGVSLPPPLSAFFLEPRRPGAGSHTCRTPPRRCV